MRQTDRHTQVHIETRRRERQTDMQSGEEKVRVLLKRTIFKSATVCKNFISHRYDIDISNSEKAVLVIEFKIHKYVFGLFFLNEV